MMKLSRSSFKLDDLGAVGLRWKKRHRTRTTVDCSSVATANLLWTKVRRVLSVLVTLGHDS